MFDLEYKEIHQGKGLQGLRIVQISDLHISKNNFDVISDVKDYINSLKADMVTVTGDFICNGGAYLDELCHFLKKMDAKVGKYACMGNHDYADGEDGKKLEKALLKSDFRLLKNSRHDILYNNYSLGISGLDDVENGKISYKAVGEGDIILSHNPITFLEAKKYNPCLMLSGHTHGGHLKLDFLKALYSKLLGCDFLSGFYKSDKSSLYVNRGLGDVVLHPRILGKDYTFTVPRLNSNCEVTVFDFE